MEERKELILINEEETFDRPKRQWKKQVELSDNEQYDIKKYLIKLLDTFYMSYLDYVCGVAKDREYEIKNFINGSDIWYNYRDNLFYPIYKYIKQYYKIEEPFISYTKIIEIVERFFREKNFQGLKFSFEDSENRDSNVDYELKDIYDDVYNLDEVDNTVVIEFLFGEEKYNFKLRTHNYCSIRKRNMPLRVELLLDNPLLMFKNLPNYYLNGFIDQYKNVGYGGETQVTIYVSQSIDKIVGHWFFKDMFKNKSNHISINYYLEDYPTIEIRNKKEIEDYNIVMKMPKKGKEETLSEIYEKNYNNLKDDLKNPKFTKLKAQICSFFEDCFGSFVFVSIVPLGVIIFLISRFFGWAYNSYEVSGRVFIALSIPFILLVAYRMYYALKVGFKDSSYKEISVSYERFYKKEIKNDENILKFYLKNIRIDARTNKVIISNAVYLSVVKSFIKESFKNILMNKRINIPSTENREVLFEARSLSELAEKVFESEEVLTTYIKIAKNIGVFQYKDTTYYYLHLKYV